MLTVIWTKNLEVGGHNDRCTHLGIGPCTVWMSQRHRSSIKKTKTKYELVTLETYTYF